MHADQEVTRYSLAFATNSSWSCTSWCRCSLLPEHSDNWSPCQFLEDSTTLSFTASSSLSTAVASCLWIHWSSRFVEFDFNLVHFVEMDFESSFHWDFRFWIAGGYFWWSSRLQYLWATLSYFTGHFSYYYSQQFPVRVHSHIQQSNDSSALWFHLQLLHSSTVLSFMNYFNILCDSLASIQASSCLVKLLQMSWRPYSYPDYWGSYSQFNGCFSCLCFSHCLDSSYSTFNLSSFMHLEARRQDHLSSSNCAALWTASGLHADPRCQDWTRSSAFND